MPRVELHAEERVAEVPADQVEQLTTGDADADRLVPVAGAREVRRDQLADVVARPGGQVPGRGGQEAAAGDVAAPVPEGGAHRVAAAQPPPGRTGQPERGPLAGQHHRMVGERQPDRPELGERLELGHARPHREQHPAHGRRAVRRRELETRDLVDVVAQPQPGSGADEDRGRVHRLAAECPEHGHQVGGHLDPVRRARLVVGAEVLPARDAHPLRTGAGPSLATGPGAAHASLGQQAAQWPAVGPGLVDQAEALVPDHLDPGRHHRRIGDALVAHEQHRRPARHEDEQRLLEPGVEAGQVGQVGEVLPVGVDEQRVKPGLGRRGGRRGQARLVGLRRHRRLGGRQPEIGYPDLGKLDTGRPGHAPACGAGPAGGAGASQSTSPSASLRLPTSTVAPRRSTPGLRRSRHCM